VVLGVSKLPYLGLILASHVSHCLPLFAPVTVKSLSKYYLIQTLDLSAYPSPEPGRFDLGVVAVLLAAGIVAEPIVATGLPAAFY